MARVTEVESGVVHLRFLNGSDAVLPTGNVRPFSVLPGTKLEVPWPDWGWWNCTVVSYDRENDKVTVTDGMDSKSFHLSDVRLKREGPSGLPQVYSLAVLLAVAATTGVLGVLIGHFLFR